MKLNKRLLFLLVAMVISAVIIHPIFAGFFWPTVGKSIGNFFIFHGWASQNLDTPTNVVMVALGLFVSLAIEATFVIIGAVSIYRFTSVKFKNNNL